MGPLFQCCQGKNTHSQSPSKDGLIVLQDWTELPYYPSQTTRHLTQTDAFSGTACTQARFELLMYNLPSTDVRWIFVFFLPVSPGAAMMGWWAFSDRSWTSANGRVWALALAIIWWPPPPRPQSASAIILWQILLQRPVGWKVPLSFWYNKMSRYVFHSWARHRSCLYGTLTCQLAGLWVLQSWLLGFEVAIF